MPLQGPRLDAADRLLPLPVLRSRISDLLDQAAARLERARDAAPPTSPWTPLADIARPSVTCIALAIGFAGLARRRVVPLAAGGAAVCLVPPAPLPGPPRGSGHQP